MARTDPVTAKRRVSAADVSAREGECGTLRGHSRSSSRPARDQQ
ncbi:hypothetical protein AZ78_2070 [Lysobacter capsici AZ78]|uniref:Uncharacterized protein n=1 Tax=Lysobacter capsici AZ78 TaxID=1444315 RepID=A0A125MMU7_9GAMM|nr:hypothetical protein AZ78_2070 [Lysobacter capsici AZ78]